MTQSTDNSRGGLLARRLQDAIRQSRRLLNNNARDLPKLHGVSKTGVFSCPMENVLSEGAQILERSGKVYSYGNCFVLESGSESDGRLITLMTDGRLETTASSLLANIFICESQSAREDASCLQFAPTRELLELVLNHESTRLLLPRIEFYAKRPVFDCNFNYRDVGWHLEVGYMIHSTPVTPILPEVRSDNPRDNIPPTLLRLLRGFLFKSDNDLINTIGVFLTGLLASCFISTGKALALLDGNQPGVGKTLLARTIGIVMDGIEPDLIRYDPNDTELEKRICASLRSKQSSVILIDNAKVKAGTSVSSLVIEAQSVAPEISMRILCTSLTYQRPNDVIWTLTMNNTQVSPDTMSRAIPIQFQCEGDPAQSDFGGFDPISFAKQNRFQILAELAGMVIHWNQQGRPEGTSRHRLQYWATTISGILEACGLPGFLMNVDELQTSFDSDLDQLARLAETALVINLNNLVVRANIGCDVTANLPSEVGLTAGELVGLFQTSGVLADELKIGSSKSSSSSRIANFLTRHLNREVPIEHNGRVGTAVLGRRDGRSNKKYYYFVVRFEDGDCEGCPSDEITVVSTPPGFPTNQRQQMTAVPSDIQQATQTALPPLPPSSGDHGNSESWLPG